MNKLFNIVLVCGFAALLAAGCSKEPLLTYRTSNNIFFDYIRGANPAANDQGLYYDFLDISFAFSRNELTDTTIAIPVGVTGLATDNDRSFSVNVDPSSTAQISTDFEFPTSFLLRAGRTQDSLYVRFKRTPQLKTKTISLKLLLQENDQFTTNLKLRPRSPNQQTSFSSQDTVLTTVFQINVTDMLQAGPYWMDYYYSFGEFSEKKVRLMNQIVGMPMDFWSEPADDAEKLAQITYFGGFVARYLSDQAYAGNLILEDDGVTPMKMGNRFP